MILADVYKRQDLDIVSSGYVEKDIETGRIYGEGINYARRLADTPSNLMTPEDMVKEAVELAKAYNIEYTILNKSALEEMKAGGILSVNQGSHIPVSYTHLSLSFTSQNMGAKNYSRVNQILVRCLVVVSIIGFVLGFGAYLLGEDVYKRQFLL